MFGTVKTKIVDTYFVYYYYKQTKLGTLPLYNISTIVYIILVQLCNIYT